jgi:ABC-type transporter Mla subunit MlaD
VESEVEYLTEQVTRLTTTLGERNRQLASANATIDLLEKVVHKATQIAQHIPYLCSSLPEHSPELDQAALQLQEILVRRNT